MKTTQLLLVLLSTTAAGVDAQQLYKSVGPDGKVTFSDRPPGGSGKISVMRSSVLRPMEADAPASAIPPTLRLPVTPASPRSAGAAAAVHAPSTPELEEAVSAVMLLAEVAKRFEPLCSANPVSAKQYSVAVNGWRTRNANFISQHARILMEVLDPIRRSALQAKVNARITEALAQVSSLNPSWRSKWCERAVLDMTSGTNDVANNPTVAVPLITYKFK